MTPISEYIARAWSGRRIQFTAANEDAPLTIAFDVYHYRPGHPDMQKKLGANISMEEFHACFPNSNLWTSDEKYVWVCGIKRDELQRVSEKLARQNEIIFVDEEGP